MRGWRMTLVLLVASAGCNGSGLQRGEAEAQRDFRIGAPREEIIKNRSSSGLIIMPAALPDDEFLQATVREIASLGKARPTYYETFPIPATRNAYKDYVFYDGHRRVMYVARRRVG